MNKYFKLRGLVIDPETGEKTTDQILPQDYAAMRDFKKLKIGKNVYDNPILTLDYLGDLHSIDPRYTDKRAVLRAMHRQDYEEMREISDFFFNVSGIYSRLCKYMAYLYRYDWLITPYNNESVENANPDKVLAQFYKALTFMDDFGVKKFLSEVALKVVRYGVYYGYKSWVNGKWLIQELPPKYCRSRFQGPNGWPLVEFNMRFFDDMFKTPDQRMRMLRIFPDEFAKGYRLYKEGKLVPQFQGDSKGWYLLDERFAFKFNLNGEDFPAFISVIPAIIDLNNAQGVDRQRMEQLILKILIQKMPIDKNGDMVFDPDEALEMHRNAVAMVGGALGLEVLTTYADVDVEDMADDNNTTTDELEKVERTVYNEAGTPQMLFNTDGNLALEKSILNDEACMHNLILQFEVFLNGLLEPFNQKPKKVIYKLQMLSTTIYNYKEMAKTYKELTQLGFSKMLPAIALGESQSSVLANAYFENELLELQNVFIPPLSSNVMNGDLINPKSKQVDSDNKGGRPEKADDEKSEKTIQNKESMS